MRGRKLSFSAGPSPDVVVGQYKRGQTILLLDAKRSEKQTASRCGLGIRIVRKWRRRFLKGGGEVGGSFRSRSRAGLFPKVTLHLVKMTRERRAERCAALSQWDCEELACQLQSEGIVSSISPSTVHRVLGRLHLKPWRQHAWLSARVPRDTDYAARVSAIGTRYTRALEPTEVVLCVDEDRSSASEAVCQDRPAIPGKPNLSSTSMHRTVHSTCSPRSIHTQAEYSVGMLGANGGRVCFVLGSSSTGVAAEVTPNHVRRTQAPEAGWGLMLAGSRQYMTFAWWLACSGRRQPFFGAQPQHHRRLAPRAIGP